MKQDVNIDKEFEGCAYKAIGYAIEDEAIISEEYDLNLSLTSLEEAYEGKLSKVFKIKTEYKNEKVETVLYKEENSKSPIIKVAKPKVVIRYSQEQTVNMIVKEHLEMLVQKQKL